ncbi:uncharacterized protein F4807DRAFT_411597 [Annulohypoxylon truncatum]|uniref:uncharacterized protein n=1 Tax=Annulohypoxylon truncatum TaxID=327061 RepID=UPI002008827E|nr:uncharacterized protein F4807DRAFT_411597 [Annulohypoxylon truncatum]KAI1213553.1 hypothetical protein F4807DRAFT_411597 [Annulohypoxylon truncatum]
MPSPSGVKRPLKSTNGNTQAQNTPAKRVRHRSSTKSSGAVWDVTGRYNLTCANKFKPLDATEYVLDVRYTHSSPHTCQLYASFNFPNLNLTGRMRLCPKSAIASQPTGKLFLADFEAACELAEDVRPGPKCKEWLMRWRGEGGGTKLGGETRAQGQVLFDEEKQDPDNVGTPKINIKLAMVYNGKHVILEGTQLYTSPESDQDRAAAESPTAPTEASRMLEDWKRLYDPSWDARLLSDTEEDELEVQRLQDIGATLPKPKNKWENPRSGRVISTKNKPGPIPGFIINATATSRYLEERPDWAWDVTGRYELSTIGLTKALGLSAGEPVSMVMTVQMDNNAKHQKAGRQVWAQFEANGVLALARFRPITNSLEDSLETFEKGCVLKPGVWVGPEPRGTQQWEMRWRGFSDTNLETIAEDEVGTEVLFTRDDQGKQVFRGKIRVGHKSFTVMGSRVAPTEERRPSAPTVNTEWAKFQKGKPAVSLRKNVEHVIVMEKYCYRDFPE